jgi:hypothetical protein
VYLQLSSILCACRDITGGTQLDIVEENIGGLKWRKQEKGDSCIMRIFVVTDTETPVVHSSMTLKHL